MLITGILEEMRDMHKARTSTSSQFWLLKSMAQLVDILIFHADTSTADKAEHDLLPGEASC